MSTYLDLGNGIIAYAKGTGAYRLQPGHSGLEYPTVDVPVTENAVLDGAAIGSSRSRGRRMVLPLWIRGMTRQQIAAAFSPGVERTITSAIGSMPYYVEDCIFNSTALATAQEVRVAIVSPLAYPEAALTSVTIAGGGGWAAEAISDEQTTSNADYDFGSGAYSEQITSIGQTFGASAGEKMTGVALKAGDEAIGYGTIRVYGVADGLPTGADLYTYGFRAITIPANTETKIPLDYVFPTTGDYAVVLERSEGTALGNVLYNTAGGYAGGQMVIGNGNYEWTAVTGDDLYFKVYTQAVDGGTGSATFTADTDVPVAPVITCTMVTPNDDIVLAGDGWTTTITATLIADDVIEVDAANFTVKVNGVSHLAYFDRSGEWPRVTPGSNTITVTPAAGTSIAFAPRRMGLI
jgi:hypothetical protein